KTPVGIKVGGPDLAQIQQIGQQLETILANVEGTASVYSERVAGGRYIKIDIKREQAARYGLNIADIQETLAAAVGGINVSQSVEGRKRYPINVRYLQDYRSSPEALLLLPIITLQGAHIALGDVASISIEDGPPGIKSENARPTGWVYIDIENIDIGHYVSGAMLAVSQQLVLPAGYSITWSGQYEYMQRAKEKLTYVVPLTIAIIIILLYLNFRNMVEVGIIMGTLPFAMIGGIWLLYLEGFNFSVAVGVGFIALAGVAVQIGVIMLVYLNQTYKRMLENHHSDNTPVSLSSLQQAVLEGAVMRVRPVMMTSAAIILGLLPVLYGTGTGSEIMSRIAAPMVGGMVSALLLTLLILPAIYLLWKKRGITQQ
ncbi:MAG: Cu(I)/Ag(I) efflux system membrane protein CusA/SilA, partial [Gammaproteobacteria bacterium]